MTITNHSLNFFAQNLFAPFLHDDAVTEIAINRPGHLWFEKFGTWQKHESSNITNKLLKSFAVAFAGFNDGCIDDVHPILSGTLETKERVQVVFPPAVEKNTISITLRKPSNHIFPHSSYISQGFYQNLQTKKVEQNELIGLYRNGKFPRFLELAATLGKTIVFAGATGSGKTSFMKTLIEYIPLNCRLITIEDTSEVKFVKHENYVHLFFPSEAASNNNAIVTPSQLLKACFRMKPDRILLSEIRGAETWEFLKVISSGHGGTMTSMHAGSVHEAIEGIITRCFQNPECQNLSYQIIKNMVLANIDIICHINCHNGKRYLSDIYFKDADHNMNFVKSA